jgi:hypothetical protein
MDATARISNHRSANHTGVPRQTNALVSLAERDEVATLTKPHYPPGWAEIDSRTVDTVRILAADAVQKVGNGHPGTAMSLAPLAYTLFQGQMRHDPTDVHWLGRGRFILSAGHSGLTLYLQLYRGGFGLELSDIQSLPTFKSKTPGRPEFRHSKGEEITTGPLGQGWHQRSAWRWPLASSAACSIPTQHGEPALSITSSTASPPTDVRALQAVPTWLKRPERSVVNICALLDPIRGVL